MCVCVRTSMYPVEMAMREQDMGLGIHGTGGWTMIFGPPSY